MKLRVKKTRPEAVIPEYKSKGASGLDLTTLGFEVVPKRDTEYTSQTYILMANERIKISTGLAFEVPEGYEGQIRPRSGTSDLGLSVRLGTIDSDYRGEVKVLIANSGKKQVELKVGERLAQIVFAPVVRADLEEADQLSETDRGSNGFGSTGK